MDVFHRKANRRSQKLSTAIKQNRNKEMWGRGAYTQGLPAVVAFKGELGQSEGTEFTTDVPFAINGHPEWAYWYLDEGNPDSSVKRKDINKDIFACIDIEPRRNRYRCKKA